MEVAKTDVGFPLVDRLRLGGPNAAEVAGDAAAEIERLRARVQEWETWYEGVVADFLGLTTDSHDPDRLHDWEWMDDHRPAPLKYR